MYGWAGAEPKNAAACYQWHKQNLGYYLNGFSHPHADSYFEHLPDPVHLGL